MVDHPYLFASYSRQDAEKVQAFISGLKEGGINVWSDENLRPGENWRTSIQTSLLSAAGLLVFVSNFSMKSEWVRSELAAVARDTDRQVDRVERSGCRVVTIEVALQACDDRLR